ncbi:MAG: hypothetical protein WCF67_08645 [Chitinophagaceae bacterium]
MKNILAAAVLVLGLMACGDNATTNGGATTGDSLNNGLTTDTAINSTTLNPADSMGITRDTARKDRTDVRTPGDTLRRRDSAR